VPELPEVETVCRGLNQVTRLQQVRGGDVLLARTIAHPVSVDDFLAGLQGVAIAKWHRRGKYLLAELCKTTTAKNEGADVSPTPQNDSLHSPAGWLGVHLRMTGQLLWLTTDKPLQKHTRVRLFFAGNHELRFVDQRTFGQMWWVPPNVAPETVITGLQKLGTEPFGDEFSVEYLTSKLQNRRRPIKTALLDQSLVAGVGNIYADEALFLSGIRPETLCATLNAEQLARIRNAIIQVLQASIEAGGTTFSDFLSVLGVNGNYGGVAWVYGRDGEPCRVCGTTIKRTKLAGRSSHYCAQCQR
jgi:formamidopyrimidine-DNA glycosylase